MMDLFQNPSSLKSNNFQTAMWASKLVLMSIGVISILVLLKVAIIPYTFHLLLSTLPSLWASARSWLSLPFIYIIVNFIIIIIAVSSNFHHKSTPFSEVSTHQTQPESHRNEPKEEAKEVGQEEQEEEVKEEVKDFGLPFNKFIIESTLEKSKSKSNNNKPKEGAKEIEEKEREEVEDFGLSFNKFTTQKTSLQKSKSKRNVPKEEEAKEIEQEREEVKEFGLSFNKFITHKTSPLEKCTNDFLLDYDDDDDDDDDSMEATWRAIMEGQGKMMKPQLKKSDTWGARITKAEPFNDSEVDDHVAWAQRELKKSETFNDRVSLRRDKSMSPEELNRRAEDFIKKFNNEMKLQRLESHQRYLDMVNGSV